MVGILRADVAAAATGAGTHSRTTEKHPASCRARAVSTTYPKVKTKNKKEVRQFTKLTCPLQNEIIDGEVDTLTALLIFFPWGLNPPRTLMA